MTHSLGWIDVETRLSVVGQLLPVRNDRFRAGYCRSALMAAGALRVWNVQEGAPTLTAASSCRGYSDPLCLIFIPALFDDPSRC
jgi:hypothetical protein